MNPEEHMLRQWQAKRLSQPHNGNAVIGIGKSLAALGRIDELIAYAAEIEAERPAAADHVLRFGMDADRANTTVGIAFCQAAERRGDTEGAITRWSMLRRRQPKELAPHLGLIEALLAAGRLPEAERAVGEAIGKLRDPSPIAEIQARVQQALAQTTQTDTNQIPSTAGEDEATLKTLLMGFESLGSNCEFGLLQRKFGAEPLGLMRFAKTSPTTLVHLLRTRFAGLGSPEAMRIAGDASDYRIAHVNSAWQMHIPRETDMSNMDKVFRDQVRHASFLRKKLLADLERQTKIYVYRAGNLTLPQIEEIHDALLAYGPNRLLCVGIGTADHPAGEIRTPREGLMIAALDRFGFAFKGAGWDISVDYWIHFLRAAQARFRPGV